MKVLVLLQLFLCSSVLLAEDDSDVRAQILSVLVFGEQEFRGLQKDYERFYDKVKNEEVELPVVVGPLKDSKFIRNAILKLSKEKSEQLLVAEIISSFYVRMSFLNSENEIFSESNVFVDGKWQNVGETRMLFPGCREDTRNTSRLDY